MIVMVDLEGTLSDNTVRLATLQVSTMRARDQRDPDAWKKYYKGLIDDDPRPAMIELVRKLIREGNRVIIYSTRFINKYNHEEEWLKGHELWQHVEFFQREPGQRMDGPALIAQWVRETQPAVLIDDRLEVRDRVRGLVPGLVIMDPADFNPPAEQPT
jgi:hypothetical protein